MTVHPPLLPTSASTTVIQTQTLGYNDVIYYLRYDDDIVKYNDMIQIDVGKCYTSSSEVISEANLTSKI